MELIETKLRIHGRRKEERKKSLEKKDFSLSNKRARLF